MGEKRLDYIPLVDIIENKVALRSVDVEGEAFRELVESIRSQGILDSINVREKVDEETGETKYEIINGLHRVTAAKELGLDTVPAQVLSASEGDVLEMQLVANLMRVDTKPSEYTKQIRRMLNMNPMLTIGELSQKLGKGPQWIQDRLSLGKIKNDKVMALIDENQITLANAFALAKLPEAELPDWIDSAMTQEAAEFVPRVNQRVKEIRDAERKGRDANPPTFEPTAHSRKIKDVKAELDSGEAADVLISQTGVSSAKEGFTLGVQWCLHLDVISVEAQRVKWEEREAARAEAKKKREAEKAKKKAEAAAAKAAEAKEAAEALEG